MYFGEPYYDMYMMNNLPVMGSFSMAGNSGYLDNDYFNNYNSFSMYSNPFACYAAMAPSIFNMFPPAFNFNFEGGGGSLKTPSLNEKGSVSDDIPSSVSKKGMFLKGKGKDSEYGPKFLAKVKEIAGRIKCDYRDLLAIMNSESGINAKTVGKNGASGLICFMPQYYDVSKIRKMSPMEQLDLVEKTFLKAKEKYGFANAKLSKGDLYTLIFLPARAKQEVLARKGEGNRYYEANAGLDANKDGKITKEEMAVRIDKKYVSDESFLA